MTCTCNDGEIQNDHWEYIFYELSKAYRHRLLVADTLESELTRSSVDTVLITKSEMFHSSLLWLLNFIGGLSYLCYFLNEISNMKWHHMGAMASQITGNSTPCSTTACQNVHQRTHQWSKWLALLLGIPTTDRKGQQCGEPFYVMPSAYYSDRS